MQQPSPKGPNGRSSSNSEMMQAFHMLLKSVTESFTQAQKDSIELQEATLEQIRGMADSIRLILSHAMADPSRADILREVVESLRNEFDKHDVKCSGRNKEEMGRHQDQMERIIDFKAETAASLIARLEAILEQAAKDIAADKKVVTDLHTNISDTLERLDGYGKWMIAIGIVGACMVPVVAGALYWMYSKVEVITKAIPGVTQ